MFDRPMYTRPRVLSKDLVPSCTPLETVCLPLISESILSIVDLFLTSHSSLSSYLGLDLPGVTSYPSISSLLGNFLQPFVMIGSYILFLALPSLCVYKVSL